MMSLTFGLFTQVSGSGPLGPLVFTNLRWSQTSFVNVVNMEVAYKKYMYIISP